MKRMFISTNYNSLQYVIGDNKDNFGINLLKSHDILCFNSAHNIFQINNINDSQLFLVKDITEIISAGEISLDNDYLMRHSICNHSNSFKKIHSLGRHEEEDPYYTKVFSIIFDDRPDKAERIIKFLFKEAAIETDEDKIDIDVIEAYRKVYKLITLDYIKLVIDDGSPKVVSSEIKENITAIKSYFEENNLGLKNEFIELHKASDLDMFYQLLITHHSSIELKIFA